VSYDLERTTSYFFRGREIFCVDPGHPPGNAEADVKERHWHVAPGEVVLDIGASHGSYLMTACSMGAARVYGWAPEGDFPVLVRNIELNGWRGRAVPIREGLWSSPGWVRTNPSGPDFRSDEPPPASNRFVNAYGLAVERPEVGPWFPVMTLDGLFAAGGSRTDLWKLDVEGAELHVLYGGEQLLKRDRPRVLVESHDCYVPGIGEAVRDFLLELGVGYREVLTTPCGDGRAHSFYQVGGVEVN
jgi:FkbM family methyltransferase